jgi:hypothetical protein
MRVPKDFSFTFSPDRLVVPFEGADRLNNRYYSQALQDIYALSCLNGKTDGVFLDLGCNHPYRFSNSYLMESQFNWKGICVDIDPASKIEFKEAQRKATVLIQDATTLDFNVIADTLGTTHIDYLSLDLEPASVTLKCLQSIPFDVLSFSVITFEHDGYRFGDEARIPSRELLKSKGYVLVCENVDNFEDWYINPDHVPVDRIKPFVCTGDHKSASNIVLKLN